MQKLQQICDDLVANTAAQLVSLIDESGRELHRAGEAEGFDPAGVAAIVAEKERADGEFSFHLHRSEAASIYVTRLTPSTILAVAFTDKASLGVMLLRVTKASAEIVRLLSRPPTGP